MGFFSANCKRCDHPLLSVYAITAGVNDWMIEAVAISPDDEIFKGEYDGYGRIGSVDTMEMGVGGLEDLSVYHEACWVADGSPTTYQGPSWYAEDQGYFFEDGAHDLPKPEPLITKTGRVLTDEIIEGFAAEDARPVAGQREVPVSLQAWADFILVLELGLDAALHGADCLSMFGRAELETLLEEERRQFAEHHGSSAT